TAIGRISTVPCSTSRANRRYSSPKPPKRVAMKGRSRPMIANTDRKETSCSANARSPRAEGSRTIAASRFMATTPPAATIWAPTKTPAATRTRADSSAFAIIVSFPTGEDGHRCVSGPTDPSSHRHGVHGLQKNGQVQEQAPSVDVVHVEVELVLPIEFV